LSLKRPQCLLALLGDSRVRQNSSGWDCRGVIALDDPSTNARLVLELERRLKQIGVQSGGSIKPNQGLRRGQALQPAVTDQAANNRTILLFDPSVIVLAVGTRPDDL